MKKTLTIILIGLTLATQVFAATPAITIPQGGTGTTTFPINWFVTGNTDLRLTATGTPFFTGFSFLTATGTSATTTNFFATTASSSRLFTALFNGAGLSSCSGAGNALTWASGLFGCATGFLNSATAASTYVPYTGGTANVDLGAHNLTVNGDIIAGTTKIANNSGVLFYSNGNPLTDTNGGLLYSDTNTLVDSSLNLHVKNTLYLDGYSDGCLQVSGTGVLSGACHFGDVISVTDNGTGVVTVNNSDTLNPIVTFNGVYVDGATITGDGTLGNPLVATGGGAGTVSSVTDNGGGTLTISPNIGPVLAGINLGNNNIWTAASTTFTGGVTINRATTTQATTTNLAVSSVASKLLLTNAGGSVSGYAGTTCTNQFVRVLSALGVATCATVANTDLTNSSLTVNGTSIALGASGTITAASSTLYADNGNFTGANQFATMLVTGSSTLQNFTFVNATGTSATTTNFFSTTASSSKLFTGNFNGANLSSCTGTNGLTWSGGLFGCTAIPQGTVTSVSGTSNRITSTGGATPVIDISGSYVGQSSITTVGTLSAGAVPASLVTAGTFGAGDYVFPANLTITSQGTLANLLVTGSSTLQNFTGLNSTTTNATSTTSFATTASSSKLFSASANFGALTLPFISGTQCLHSISGVVSGTGSDCGSGSGSGGNSKWATSTVDSTAISPNSATKVGIGTTTPSRLFQVWGTQAGGIAEFTRAPSPALANTSYGTQVISLFDPTGVDGSGPAQTFNYINAGGTTNVLGSIGAVREGADTTGKLTLSANVAGSLSQVLVVDGVSGNVAIGTSTPSAAANSCGANGFCVVNQPASDSNAEAQIKLIAAKGANEVRAFATARFNTTPARAEYGTETNHPLWFYINGGNSPFDSGIIAAMTANGMGIGTTTTSNAELTVASSTRPQLSLVDRILGNNAWTMRAVGNNLYFATSSPSTFATSTTAVFAIDANGIVNMPSGHTSYASSTIGGGGATNGLTINGNASSTGLGFHIGPVNCKIPLGLIGGKGLEICQDDNVITSGSNLVLANNNSGANAFADMLFTNDQADTAVTKYAVLNLNSSGFSNTLYGTGFNVANLFQLQNTMGGVYIGATSGTAADSIRFFTGGSATTNERGVITQNGNVGFGTTTPSIGYGFGVVVASTTPTIDLMDSDAPLNAKHVFFQNNGGVLSAGTSTDSVTASSTWFTAQSTTDNATHVGIATTSNYATFSVLGTGVWQGLTSSTAGSPLCILSNFSIVSPGGATCALSSKYIKHDIADVTKEQAENAISNLRPISYTNNDDGTNHYGFVAEEVAQVDPRIAVYETVESTIDGHTFKVGDPLSVDYDKTTALIVKYLQDHKATFEGAKRSAEENWQWGFILVLALVVIRQQYQIKKLMK